MKTSLQLGSQACTSRVDTMPGAQVPQRVKVLDGWRAISILSVLGCHLLPLGPKRWDLNAAAGPLGMVLFFHLSGFLITTNLIERPSARVFFIRRACRILPLAIPFMVITLLWQGEPFPVIRAHLLFYVNYVPDLLTPVTSPLWSLCLEVQFYLLAGLLVVALGRAGLYALPLLCVMITALRCWQSVPISLATHLRGDEILVGAMIALLHHSARASHVRNAISAIPWALSLLLLLVCCHPASGPMQYFRPYAGALLIAGTLWRESAVVPWLEARTLKYVAAISYALYVFHPLMRLGWFGSGGGWDRYLLKRPIGFVFLFAVAHLSTFQYESRWITFGKRMSSASRRAMSDGRS